MRIVFMGTSAFGKPALDHIHKSGHDLTTVYTQPPRPAGRGQKLQKTPIHDAAQALDVPVLTPAALKTDDAAAALRALSPDLAVVAAYGLILPKAILDVPIYGAINLHASILPRWRGAAPVQRAILAGDDRSGVSIFQMERGLDTGPVYAVKHCMIGASTNASKLLDALAELAAEMLPEILDGLAAGGLHAIPQSETGACYAHKVTKQDGALDFREPATMIERRLRALNPWPGCFCHVGRERLSLLAGSVTDQSGKPGEVIETPLTIACGQGALRVDLVKRAGKRAMPPDELQRGMPIPAGKILE